MTGFLFTALKVTWFCLVHLKLRKTDIIYAMKTVGIITEYNPFHNGHKLQYDRIAQRFGANTAIVTVMSGSFTQRGEPAIVDKWSRARMASASELSRRAGLSWA